MQLNFFYIFFLKIVHYDWMTSDICTWLFFVVNANDLRCI